MILEIARQYESLPGTINWSDEYGLYRLERGQISKFKLSYRDLGAYGTKTDNLEHLGYLVNEWNYHELIGGIGGVSDIFVDIALNKNLSDELRKFFENDLEIKNRLEEIYEDYLEQGWIHESNTSFLKNALNHFVEKISLSYMDAKNEHKI